MARQYILREPEHVRKEVAFNVALLMSLSVVVDSTRQSGVSVTIGIHPSGGSALPDDKRNNYAQILEKIEKGVPLNEIDELRNLSAELEAEDERRRVFRNYRRQYRKAVSQIAENIEKPSPEILMTHLDMLRTHPLSPSRDATPRMLRTVFKPHPYLAGDEFIDSGFLHHLSATDFADEQLILRFLFSIQKRHGAKEARERIDDSIEAQTPAFDELGKIIYEGSSFVFTGKFRFGSRTACRKAVLARGALFGDNVTRDTDYLVIASGWANTSPTSSKLQSFRTLRDKG